MINVSIVTLGCSKNDVDSDKMRSLMDENKFQYISDLNQAEAIVVNTCGFIEQAKEESIDTILEIAQLKETGKLKKLLLAGCLAQRYPDELLEAIPEADGIIGPGYISSINEALDQLYLGKRIKYTDIIETSYVEGIYKVDPQVTEYVKISEGCNNNCHYCIIPKLKGRNKSRKIEDIIEEVKYLTEKGTREILLIGQNTTDYGIDLYGEYKLKDLLFELRSIEKLRWIRILYAYPDHFDKGLISEIRDNPKVLPYIDIPLQHISNHVLASMGRKTDKNKILYLIKELRKNIPDLIIRSTFLVGYPGEKEEDFVELLDFLKENPLDRVGCFSYSKEEGTLAAESDMMIPEQIRLERQKILMQEQEKISEELMKKWISRSLEVLVMEKIEDHLFLGRSVLDAPEIDGLVYINSGEDLRLDSFIKVRITDSMEFDLVGDYIEYSK